MRTAEKDKTRRRQARASGRDSNEPGYDAQGHSHLLGLHRANLLLLAGAAAAIVVGYVLLGRGSITAAPILLVVGYAVLTPAGLLVRSRRSED